MPRLLPRSRPLWLPLASLVAMLAEPSLAADAMGGAEMGWLEDWPWWCVPAGLFVFCTLLGVLAVMAGIGGGVLFVPIVGGFVTFIHIDFVRGTGLMIALAGALAAGPGLLRANLVNLRLVIPVSLIASIGAIFGARLGLLLPPHVVQAALGVTILAIAVVMVLSRPVRDTAAGDSAGGLARVLDIRGVYRDPARGQAVPWHPRRLEWGLLLFFGVGLLAGMFGLGAGWANVPVLNLVMGLPLKVAVASSYFLLAITDSTAVWVYLHEGAVQPLITAPAVLGIVVGATFGARLLRRARPSVLRGTVVAVLVVAGLRALLRGFGI